MKEPPKKYVGTQDIADYCGVARTAVYQWMHRHGPESRSDTPVPPPAVAITQGRDKEGNQKFTYGWAPSQLHEFRMWYADLRGWSDKKAAHHWVEVDAKLRESV